MTLREFRKVNIDNCLTITVLSEQAEFLDYVEVDYIKDTNLDYMLDLYALDAKVCWVDVNHTLNMLSIAVTVDTNHPLYRYSKIDDRSGRVK